MAQNLNTKSAQSVGWTNLFPCAVGVHIGLPKTGLDASNKDKDILGKNHLDFIPPVTIFPQDKKPANKKYVNMLSSDIKFSEDVIEDRCLFMMPYNNKYFEDIFKPGELISKRPISRSKSSLQFSNLSRQTSKLPILPPLKKDVQEKATQLHKQAIISTHNTNKNNNKNCLSNDSFFITACPGEEMSETLQTNERENVYKNKTEESQSINIVSQSKQNISQSSVSEQNAGDWDDYLISGLSQSTANWIVHTCIPPDKQKEKLSSLLESWYGPPTHTDLVRDELSDGEEEDDKTEKPKRKWVKQEALLLSAVDNVTPNINEALDPYSDENKAPFYRQPLGIRTKKRTEKKEEAGVINSTAQIFTKELKEPKPITLQDLLSPLVGDKVYITDNEFQQEWLTGKKPVFNPSGDPNVIVMETDHKYLKHLQREVPEQPESWFPAKQASVKAKSTNLPSIGHRKWTALPDIIDESAGILIDPHIQQEPKTLAAFVQGENSNIKEKNSLLSIANAWRSQWFISSQYSDSTPDDLIRDMMDIQPHVRMKAISTLAKAAELMTQHKTLDEPGDKVTFDLPKKLFIALECLLEDNHEQVGKAAAIALYSFNRPTEKAKQRLQKMLFSEAPVDRWAAAQCLAHYGETDSDVVAEILKQIMMSEDSAKFEQGVHLLVTLSNHTTLVHCMVAEQLNSNSWRHRVMACKLLPTLFGTINRDISQKLSDLMWYDWHEEVRTAAAQCLGKAGHGRDVHDDIRLQLMTGTERTKVEALSKIGQLGLMTGKLLPAFLECFAESYVSIRAEVCRTCANLKIKEEQILNRLVHLATFDPIWQIKALAMQALGLIGELNEDIKESLLWALRYEEQAGVRAEACHSIMLLDARDEEVILALQERLLVESNEMVREEMKLALSKFGVSVTEDMDTVKQIKSEIVKLCTRNVIASQILIHDEEQSKQQHLEEMVCQTEADKKILDEKRDNQLRLIRSRAQGSPPSSHPTTPRHPMRTTSSAGMSRVAFTPSADKELEALFSLDGAESFVTKSRPLTRDSDKSVAESEAGLSIGRTEGASRFDSRAAGSEEVDDTYQRSSTSKSGKQKQNAETMQSMQDMKLSGLSHFERKFLLSRDALKERQLLDQEVSTIYSDLESRYMEMVNELIEADRGLNAKPLEEANSLPQLGVLKVATTNSEIIDNRGEADNPDEEIKTNVALDTKTKNDPHVDTEEMSVTVSDNIDSGEMDAVVTDAVLNNDTNSDVMVTQVKDADLNKYIDSEVMGAEVTDAKLNNDIDSEVKGAEVTDAKLNNDIDSEVMGAEVTDAKLNNDIDSEVMGAEVTDAKLNNDIDSEVMGAEVTDAKLNNDIDSEVMGAEITDAKLNNDIYSEVMGAEVADAKLNNDIDSKVMDTEATDAILS